MSPQAPPGIKSNLLPPEAAMPCNLPAFVRAAQGGKAECLELLVRRCQPDRDMTYGKKRYARYHLTLLIGGVSDMIIDELQSNHIMIRMAFKGGWRPL